MNRKSETDNAWKLDFKTLSTDPVTDSNAALGATQATCRQKPHETEIASGDTDYHRRYD